MFKEGSLVRRITEAGDGAIMHVLEDSCALSNTTHVSLGNDDADASYSTSDLELVQESPTTQESTPLRFNSIATDNTTIHTEINRLFISVIKELRELGVEDRIDLAVHTNHYSGDESEISYEAYISGEETIRTDNLFTSARIAANRHFEKKTLHVAKIPHFVKVA